MDTPGHEYPHIEEPQHTDTGGYPESEVSLDDDLADANDSPEDYPVEPEDADSAPSGIVQRILDEAAAAHRNLMAYRVESQEAAEKIGALERLRAAATESAQAAEDREYSAYAQGRTSFWDNTEQHPDGYATGPQVLADAVRLSTLKGGCETQAVQEARVAAALELAGQVTAGEPTIITYRHNYVRTYSAGIPAEDGVCVRLVTTSPHNTQFYIGVNDQTNIPLRNSWGVYEQAHTPVQIEPRTFVYSGEQVATSHVTRECKRYSEEIDRCGRKIQFNDLWPKNANSNAQDLSLQEQRRGARDGMVRAITAAQAIGVRPGLGEGRQLAVDQLCVHLLDSVDNSNGGFADLVTIAKAIRHIYPDSVDVPPMDEYIKTESLARKLATEGKHPHRLVRAVLAGVELAQE